MANTDIFEYAMQFEKDGEAYYREIAEKTGDKGVATIMNMLADEEVKHYNILREMKDRTPEIAPATVLADTKNVFVKMKESGETFSPDESQVELYRKAQDLEKKSQEFYDEKAGEVDDAKQKEILGKIAEEEKRHFFILENIIQFVQKPEHYLEYGEFNHLEKF